MKIGAFFMRPTLPKFKLWQSFFVYDSGPRRGGDHLLPYQHKRSLLLLQQPAGKLVFTTPYITAG